MEKYRLYKGAWISCSPPHLRRSMDKALIFNLLNGGGYLVKQIYDFDCQEETSFWYVIKDSFGDFQELSSKMRNQVRKSLKTFDVRRISAEEMAEVGYPIYKSAIEGYKVKASLPDEAKWKEGILKTKDLKTKEYWAAFHHETGEAVAVAVNTLQEDMCDYTTLKCNPAWMHNSTYPYYGLIFEMNRYYLQEMGLKYVCDGARSITEHSNIQPFLIEKFNFRRAYCHIKITYKWYVGLAVKILYPFRKLIKEARLLALLNQEAMARGDM